MNIIDNFLPEENFKAIKEIFESANFPWYYNSWIIKENEIDLTHFQFTHTFFKNQEWISNKTILDTILNKLDTYALLRIKANLNPRSENIIEHGFHTDINKKYKFTTAVYYINDNDGYTKFKDGKIVKSKENRLVKFNSNIEHTGTNCTNQKARIVLNFNYIEKIV